jgi:hypothetical protein
MVCTIQPPLRTTGHGATSMIWLWLACGSKEAEVAPKEKLIQDYDQDGFFNDTDCDDIRSEVHPEAVEICDGIDNNCNDLIDDDDPTLFTNKTWYKDEDGDGYGKPLETTQSCAIIAGYSENDQDCNDSDAEIHPEAVEICDEVDNNCNELIDDDDPFILVTDLIAVILDIDGDGFGDSNNVYYACTAENAANNSLDCDDNNPAVHPDARDYCDGIDNNCDGILDPNEELILIFEDGTYQTIDIQSEILITEGSELHNCYETMTINDQLGIQTSLDMYNHKEHPILYGSILVYVNNEVNIHNLHIDPTNDLSNELCSDMNCYPGLMCTMNSNVRFINGSIANGSSLEGGNAFVRACTLTFENSDIINGFAERGGGIYVEYGTLTLINSYVTGNQATQGGGIYVKEGELLGSSSQISFNFADHGGGIYTQESTGTIENLLLQSNSALYSGGAGALHNSDNLGCTGCTIESNNAEKGGGFFVEGGTFNLLESTLESNIATFGGHAFVDELGSILWEDTMGKYAQGGAAWIQGGGNIDCTHSGNVSYSGFFTNHRSPGGAINIADLGSFVGIGCDMGVYLQSEDNLDADIALFSQNQLIDTQAANNDADISCTESECNYQ